jgi:hypothetical protein
MAGAVSDGDSASSTWKHLGEGIIFPYEKSGKDFSALPQHLYNRMEENYRNCKRCAGREVIAQ